jgi:NitT/TauT family transport system substrate-binding protein
MKILGCVFALALAGTALTSLAQAQTPAKPLDKVSVRYGFIATGNDAAWAYGLEKGFFKDQGLDVEFREGKGSAVTAQTVAAGSDDFGIDIDGGTFLGLAAKGLPATAIMSTAAASPLAVLSPADKPLKTPADLVGKQVAITAGDGPSTLLAVLLQRNKVPADKVTMVNLQPGPKLSSLLTGRVDAVATNIVVKATLEAKGMKIYGMKYSDFGVVTPGQYLVASNAFLESKPDVAKRLIVALQKSMEAALADPVAASEAFSKMYPAYDKTTALGELKLIEELFRSKATQGKPLGTVSLDDAKAGADVLTAAGMMPAGVDVTKFVSDKYVAK